jgi:putative acetyltransferase
MMTEAEVVRQMREHLERLFPRVCSKCNRRFGTLREYLLTTEHAGSAMPYDPLLGEWRPLKPVGIMTYANCPCGSTLTLSSKGMPLPRLWSLLTWARGETKKRGLSPRELLNYLREEICKQVLEVAENACDGNPFGSPGEMSLQIRADDLSGSEIIKLLQEHLRCMALVSPPESRHALDLDGLRKPDITFWSAWNASDLAGCGAIKQLNERHGEIKSMRTAYAFLRKGVASQILRHIIDEAKCRRYNRLSLETGSMDYFEPARKLYSSFGFARCGPFGSYIQDPNSVFMTKEI